jgi:hypothetical protein
MIKVKQVREMIAGMKDDDDFPISIAYGEDVIDNCFVRLDAVDTKRPTTPVGNIHDKVDKALFLTLSLVDGSDDDDGDECAICDDGLDPTDGDNWGELCPTCADEADAYLNSLGLGDDDKQQAIDTLRAEWEEKKLTEHPKFKRKQYDAIAMADDKAPDYWRWCLEQVEAAAKTNKGKPKKKR